MLLKIFLIIKKMKTLLLLSSCALVEATSHEVSWYAFYIGIPTILFLLYCLLTVWSWSMVSRRGMLTFWPLILLVILFPPGFLSLLLYVFLFSVLVQPRPVQEVVIVSNQV